MPPKINHRKVSDYIPAAINPNQGSEYGASVLEDSLAQFGAGRSAVADVNGEMIGGSHILQAAANAGIQDVIEIESDGTQLIIVKRKDLNLQTDARAKGLQLADNRTSELNYVPDEAVITQLLADIGSDGAGLVKAAGYTAQDVQTLLDELPTDDDTLGIHDVPDALWATDNEWDVPLLDSSMQADALDMPVVQWASGGIKKMSGTWHFYTQDKYFEPLWSDPTPIIRTGCPTIIEPNFSSNEQMPRAVALWHIYRKRWLGRYWQSQGIRMIVDLNVSQPFHDIDLLGVPKDWSAFATRWYSEAETVGDYDRAVAYTGNAPKLFMVYAGGKVAQDYCKSRGWIWVSGQRDDVINARKAAKVAGNG